MRIFKNPHTWTLLRGISKELMLDGIDERTSHIISAILAFGGERDKTERFLRLAGFPSKVSDDEVRDAKSWIKENKETSKKLREFVLAVEHFSDLPKIEIDDLYLVRYLVSREITICTKGKDLEEHLKMLEYLRDKDLLVNFFSDSSSEELRGVSKRLDKLGFEYKVCPAMAPLPYVMLDCHAVGLLSSEGLYLSGSQKSIISAYDHVRRVFKFSRPIDVKDSGKGYTNYLSAHYSYLEGKIGERGILWGFNPKNYEMEVHEVLIFGIVDSRTAKNLYAVLRESDYVRIIKIGGYGSPRADLEFISMAST